MNLYETLTAAGIETDSHESDLYFPLTGNSATILSQFPGTSHSLFKCQRTGLVWVDAAFAFTPFWEAKARCPAS